MATPLADFWEFNKVYRNLSAWIAGTAIVAPLLGAFVGISPPWPSDYASSILAAVVECAVIMAAYEFGRKGKTSIKKLRRYFFLSTLGTGVFLVAYMGLVSYFVEEVVPGYRVVIGYEYLNQNIADMIREHGYTVRQALEMFESNPEAVWTAASVRTMQFIVLIVWLLFWLAISGVCAVFVVLQFRRSSTAAKKGG